MNREAQLCVCIAILNHYDSTGIVCELCRIQLKLAVLVRGLWLVISMLGKRQKKNLLKELELVL